MGRQAFLIAGIRPEDLHRPRADGSAPTATLGATDRPRGGARRDLLAYFSVDAEAPKAREVCDRTVGDEVVLDAPLVGSGGAQFCATFEPRTAIRLGDSVEVAVDVERLHFFDPETEAALSADSSSPPAPQELDTAGVQ